MKRLLLAALLASPAAAHFPSGKLVDLSYAFDDNTIFWPTEKGFHLEPAFEGDSGKGYWYFANRFTSAEHGGTHIDAPAHFYRGRQTVDEIPLDRLTGPAVLVDVSTQCRADRDYQVRSGDLLEWERVHGRIPDGSIVLLRTGFGRFWPDRERYLGTAGRGEDAAKRLHFPGLHPEAARWLGRERKAKAVGIDTASIDHGPSATFETHVALFERNIPAFENVANLDRLPAKGFSVAALPMKIKRGSGGPLRIIAILGK